MAHRVKASLEADIDRAAEVCQLKPITSPRPAYHATVVPIALLSSLSHGPPEHPFRHWSPSPSVLILDIAHHVPIPSPRAST